MPRLFAPVLHNNHNGPKDLVARLSRGGVLKSQEVANLMSIVDRKNYTDSPTPYADRPQSILSGQTISAPHMHAHALELMLPYLTINSPPKNIKVLDCGCGSGYLTAALGRWFQQKPNSQDAHGTVYGMDIFPELVHLTRTNIQKSDGDLLESNTVQLKVGNGWNGWPEAAPFDAIHVGAAAETMPWLDNSKWVAR